MSLPRTLAARPGTLVAGICVVGVLLTGLASWAAAQADRNTEERLLETQTRQAASVLSAAVAGIQQPMIALLDAQALLPDDAAPQTFTQLFSEVVGEDELFAAASLWRQEGESFTLVESLGVQPGLDPAGPDVQSLLQRADGTVTSVVQRLEVDDRTRIAYAYADPDTEFAVYAERPIPENRRAPVDSDSAYSGLDYAIYLGSDSRTEYLTTTDVDPSDLPLTGVTARESVPFGDTALILVTSPRSHLGSSVSQRLPWLLLLGGLVLTTAMALVAQRLGRSRQQAVSDTATIQALYDRVDSLYVEQRQLSMRLQRALLPRVIPEIPGLEIAAEYVASGQGMDIGGDWYSAIALSEDAFGFVVGDVSGHGIDAVAEMARARFTLRAYLFDGATPAEALEKTSRQFDISVDGHLVTALVGVGNRRTGDVTVASAGHPRPLLLQPQGAAFVDVPAGLPLGAGRGRYESVTFTMPRRSTLLAYTDGLIERRGEAIDVGMRRLVDSVAAVLEDPPASVVASVLSAMDIAAAADDVAVLALRRVPVLS